MEEEIISSKLTRFVEPLMKMDYDPERFIYIAMQSDPTRNKKYLPWILDSFINGGIKQEEDLLSRVYPALEDYETLKSKNILSTEEKDINRYCGLVGCTKKYFREGLEPLINKYRDSLDRVEIVDRGQYEEVYRDSEVRVIHPKDEKAACYYGQSTQWCTAATRGNNMFNDYNKDGPLYILIPQSPRYEGEKYQIHKETKAYMNEKDEEVTIGFLVYRFPSLEKFFEDVLEIKIQKDGDNIHIKGKDFEEWYLSGLLHREDGYHDPSHSDGSKSTPGPAKIKYDEDDNDQIIEKVWYKNGKIHREDGPAYIVYNNRKVSTEIWYQDGKRYRIDGPTIIRYRNIIGRKSPIIESEEWLKNGKHHRIDGPAIIIYRKDGSVESEEWFYNDKRHREDGPAIINYNKDGSIKTQEFWINGKEIFP